MLQNRFLRTSLCKVILISILINSSGFVLVYKGLEILFKSLNKIELSFGGDSASYKPLSLSANEIAGNRFERENLHEFILDGKIYDFKSETTANDTTTFLCKLDINENILNEFLVNMVKEENQAKTIAAKILQTTHTIPLITTITPFFKTVPELRFCSRIIPSVESVLEGYKTVPDQPPTSALS